MIEKRSPIMTNEETIAFRNAKSRGMKFYLDACMSFSRGESMAHVASYGTIPCKICGTLSDRICCSAEHYRQYVQKVKGKL